MNQLRLITPAQADYLQAITWYENQEPGLGREFETELEALFERIRRNPESFAKVTGTVRKTRMPRFKYGVFFTAQGSEVIVLAIYHPSRNPDTLARRLK